MIILKKEYFNQRIDCDVNSCKFHDKTEDHCTLGKIKVSGQKQKCDTFCDSFKEINEKASK